MLEPFVRPRTGMALLALGVVVCAGLAMWNESVTTRSGSVDLMLLMPGYAAVLLVRIAGVAIGERQSRAEMPWGYRMTSWLLMVGNSFVFGIVGSAASLLVLGGLVVGDTAAALVPYRPEGTRTPRPRRRLPSFVLLLAGAVALFVGLHLLVAPRVPWWPLFDWGVAVVLASAALRVGLAQGGAARDEEARPPAAHRVHERTERPLPDPQRDGAEKAVEAFRRHGDLAGLAAYAEEIALAARLPEHARREVASRVAVAATRPGTTREEDLDAAVAVVERALAERERPRASDRAAGRAGTSFRITPGGEAP